MLEVDKEKIVRRLFQVAQKPSDEYMSWVGVRCERRGNLLDDLIYGHCHRSSSHPMLVTQITNRIIFCSLRLTEEKKGSKIN